MSTFNDSFNMIIGIQNKNFNWFDNPYVSLNIYELDETY